MTFRQFRYYFYIGSAIISSLAMVALVLMAAFIKPPKAETTLGIRATKEYQEATEAAMGVWNGFVGCEFLVTGDVVLVKGEDGTPCNDPFRPRSEWFHGATAYQCSSHLEILMTAPGHINTQACYVAHELGHVLGLDHHAYGVMSSCLDPNNRAQNNLRTRDDDVSRIKKQFCKP